MKKNDIFTFTAPNGAEVTGIVIIVLPSYENFEGHFDEYIVYAQNRIAFYHYNKDLNEGNIGGILVDYCIIPECDDKFAEYYHQLDMADDYADRGY